MGEQEKREQELMARVYQAEADFTLLLSELTSEEDRMEADYLYQEGVLVSEIRRMLGLPVPSPEAQVTPVRGAQSGKREPGANTLR